MLDEKSIKVLEIILDNFIESPNIDNFLLEMGRNFKDDYKTIKDVTYFSTDYLHKKNEITDIVKETIIDSVNNTPEDENCYPNLHSVLQYVAERDTPNVKKDKEVLEIIGLTTDLELADYLLKNEKYFSTLKRTNKFEIFDPAHSVTIRTSIAVSYLCKLTLKNNWNFSLEEVKNIIEAMKMLMEQ